MKVRAWIENNGDLYDFLKATKNFGKRFFTIRWHRTNQDDDVGYINVVATAVSRLLVYTVRWHIRCTIDSDLAEKYSKGYSKPGRDLNIPYGYVPNKEYELYDFYPLHRDGVYISVFDYEGFIEVGDIIDDDGTNISNS